MRDVNCARLLSVNGFDRNGACVRDLFIYVMQSGVLLKRMYACLYMSFSQDIKSERESARVSVSECKSSKRLQNIRSSVFACTCFYVVRACMSTWVGVFVRGVQGC